VTRSAEDVLGVLLSRLRVSRPLGLSQGEVDAVVRRHEKALQTLVTDALKAQDGRGGPRTEAEFAAFDILVPHNRVRDQGPDHAVLARVMRRVNAVLAEGYGELGVLQNQGREYVDARAEAILLRKTGWDAVPILSTLPALAIVAAGHVIAVRSANGTLGIHPSRTGTLNHLHADVFKVENRLVDLADTIEPAPNTRERLQHYALALWERARAGGGLS
jgi:hypothetical protein